MGHIRKLARHEVEYGRKVQEEKRGWGSQVTRCETGSMRKVAGGKIAGDINNVAET